MFSITLVKLRSLLMNYFLSFTEIIDKETKFTQEYLQKIDDVGEIKSLVKFEGDVEILYIELWKISSLIHRDESSIFAQPEVNHRPLSMSFLNNKDFLSKMQGKNNDFGEEMHALVYEVVVDKEIEVDRYMEEVKVYSTYTTTEEGTSGHEIPRTYAIYPTKEGLQKFVDALELEEKDENNKKRRLVVRNNRPAEVQRVINSWSLSRRDIYTYEKENDDGEKTLKSSNTAQVQHAYRQVVQKIKSQPIHLAMIGGLHKCGLATHLLANAYIRNAKPAFGRETLHTITPQSSINVDIPLHVIVPKQDTLRNSFVRVCAEYSKNIQERKIESFTTTIKQQMFDLLSSTVNSEKSQHVNNLRFIHYTYWTENDVREKTNEMIESGKNLEH
jgi:cell envelope opacity-associated protein A